MSLGLHISVHLCSELTHAHLAFPAVLLLRAVATSAGRAVAFNVGGVARNCPQALSCKAVVLTRRKGFPSELFCSISAFFFPFKCLSCRTVFGLSIACRNNHLWPLHLPSVSSWSADTSSFPRLHNSGVKGYLWMHHPFGFPEVSIWGSYSFFIYKYLQFTVI